MFERYQSNYNLDLWESIDRNDLPNYKLEKLPEGIDKTLALLSRRMLSESFEYNGVVYDNLDDVFHIGSAKEFTDTKSFTKAVYPVNLRATYKKDQQYPVDFFIEFIDPKSLKRIAFMIVYPNNPFGTAGEKAIGKLLLFKGKAFAAEIINKKARLAFMIKDKSDMDQVLANKALRVSWHWDPMKTLKDLKPSEIYKEIISAVSKLNSAGYKVVNDDVEDYV